MLSLGESEEGATQDPPSNYEDGAPRKVFSLKFSVVGFREEYPKT
jgi:hypothetical protein